MRTTCRALSSEDVRQALPMQEAVAAMRQAFLALAEGQAVMPPRTCLDVPSPAGTALFMPCFLPGLKAIGIKTVTLFDDNPSAGLPLLQGLYCLLDGENGSPRALLDAASLTAIRTGAVAGLASDLLARQNARQVAIFGAGVQGRSQLEGSCAVRNIQRATVYDPNTRASERFAREMADLLSIDVAVAATPCDALRHADIVCTATVASQPVFEDRDLPSGIHVNAIGSYKPHVQEIPSATVSRARVVVDHRLSALAETGDLIIPISQGLITEDHVCAELGAVVAGEMAGRQSDDQVTLFKSVGLAVQDLAAAAVAARNAQSAELGTVVFQ